MINKIWYLLVCVLAAGSVQFCTGEGEQTSKSKINESDQGESALQPSPRLILADDGGQRHRFGAAVDVSEIFLPSRDWAIVGAPGANNGKGAAYVYATPGSDGDADGDSDADDDDDDNNDDFDYYESLKVEGVADTGELELVAKLTPDVLVSASSFGYAVSINTRSTDVYAAVGDHVYSNGGVRSGAVFIFNRDEGGPDNWGRAKKISPPYGEKYDYFGSAIDTYGSYMAVGAYGDDDAGSGAGAVYLYDKNEGGNDNWGLVKKIVPSGVEAGDKFGREVAIHKDTLVVSAPDDDDLGNSAGAVYVFRQDLGGKDNWGLMQKLLPSDGDKLDFFGSAVDVYIGSDNYIAVGAPSQHGEEVFSGAVYVFEEHPSTGVWSQVAKIVPPIASVGGNFGSAVSLQSDRLSIGEFGHRANGIDSGSAYIYDVYERPAELLRHVIPNDGQVEDRFGHSISLCNSILIVGAAWNDDLGEDSGSIYEILLD